MKLSKNFTLEELVRSGTAQRLRINNTPTEKVIKNLRELCEKVLQPIREKFGEPLVVSSGYRSPALNRRLGGARTSQHLTGSAADIHTMSDTPADNKRLFDMIRQMMKDGEIKVGQLIDEYNYNWVHVSLPNAGKVNQVLSIK